MGMWDFTPWDNDGAADWYADFMDVTNFREHWIKGINEDPVDNPDYVRAAASLFVMMGRVYIWPIDHFDSDLELTINQLKKVLECEEYAEVPELIEVIQSEVNELERRQGKLGDSSVSPTKPWWKIW